MMKLTKVVVAAGVADVGVYGYTDPPLTTTGEDGEGVGTDEATEDGLNGVATELLLAPPAPEVGTYGEPLVVLAELATRGGVDEEAPASEDATGVAVGVLSTIVEGVT